MMSTLVKGMFEIPTQVGEMISKGTMEIFEMQQNRPELRMSAIIEGLVGERTDPSIMYLIIT